MSTHPPGDLATMAQGDFRSRLRGFGPVGVAAVVLILLTGNMIGTALVLLWAWFTRTPWREIGFTRWRNWPAEASLAIVGGVLLKVVMKAAIAPLLAFPARNAAYQFLTGNRAALPGMILTVIVGAGFGEETIWRGFLFERTGALLRPSTLVPAFAVTISSVLFAAAHLADQGFPGAVQALITGLVFGLVYLRVGRIWPAMVMHAAFDLTAVVMIYWNLETPIAHLLLRT